MSFNTYYSKVPDTFIENDIISKLPHDYIYTLKVNQNKTQKFVILSTNMDIDKLNELTGLEFSIKRNSYELFIKYSPKYDDIDIILQEAFQKIHVNSILYGLYKPNSEKNIVFARVNEDCFNSSLTIRTCCYNGITLTFEVSRNQMLRSSPSTRSPYMSPQMTPMSPQMTHMSPQMTHMSPQMTHISPQMTHISPQMTHHEKVNYLKELQALQVAGVKKTVEK